MHVKLDHRHSSCRPQCPYVNVSCYHALAVICFCRGSCHGAGCPSRAVRHMSPLVFGVSNGTAGCAVTTAGAACGRGGRLRDAAGEWEAQRDGERAGWSRAHTRAPGCTRRTRSYREERGSSGRRAQKASEQQGREYRRSQLNSAAGGGCGCGFAVWCPVICAGRGSFGRGTLPRTAYRPCALLR